MSRNIRFTRRGLIGAIAAAPLASATHAFGTRAPRGFRRLFDGKTLNGWHAAPRISPTWDPQSPWYRASKDIVGNWRVERGAIVSSQQIFRHGGFLVSDDAFGDFELLVDVKPDWPCDTGILLRTPAGGWPAYQVLVDHRPGGSIGGYYGNDLGGFHAIAYGLDVRRDADGHPVALVEADPKTMLEPLTDAKRALLRYKAPVETFLKSWKFGDWNRFRIRCVGHLPVITTWINDVRISEIDIGSIAWPGFDPAAVARQMPPRGHIALELHDNNIQYDPVKDDRWGLGKAVRWRNIAIRELA